jgi:hypothetical protein
VSPSRSRLTLSVFIAALIVHAAIGAAAIWLSRAPAPDFDRYYEIATGRGRPYLDYQVEHPIATLGVFKGLAALGGSRVGFGVGVVVTNLIADAAIVAALLWGWGLLAAAAFAVVALPILELLFNRIDLWSTAAATVAVAGWRRERLTVTAVACVAGAAFKLWPLLLLVLILVPRRGRVRATPVVAAAAAALLVGAVWVAVAGWRGLYEVLTFRGATGWQIESSIGAVVHLRDSASLRLESGSWRIGTTSGPISIGLFLVAAPLCLWSVWRGGRTRHVGLGWLAGVSALLVLSPLLSAQFAGWLLPGAAIAWTEGDRRPALIAALAVVLTEVFWNWYWAVIQSATPALIAVVARNAVLVLLAAVAIASLRRRSAFDADLEPDLPSVAVVKGAERR